jgi:hypothetical protein
VTVRFDEQEGAAAGKVLTLRFETNDGPDVLLLEELFRKAPRDLQVLFHQERQGDYVRASLYLSWPKEVK